MPTPEVTTGCEMQIAAIELDMGPGSNEDVGVAMALVEAPW